MLAEYKANVDLWKHDDDLRQKRTITFLTLNTALIGVLFYIMKGDIIIEPTYIIIVFMSVIGFLYCAVWIIVHKRNEQYISFRRRQLIEIECRLSGCIDTFTKQYSALNNKDMITFPKSNATFKMGWLGRWASTKVEYCIPGVLIVMWFLVPFVPLLFDLPSKQGPVIRSISIDKPIVIETSGQRIIVRMEP